MEFELELELELELEWRPPEEEEEEPTDAGPVRARDPLVPRSSAQGRSTLISSSGSTPGDAYRAAGEFKPEPGEWTEPSKRCPLSGASMSASYM